MGSEIEFFAVLLVLYLFECAAKVPLGDVLLAPGAASGSIKPAALAHLSAGSAWGWAFLNPIWTGRPAFACQETQFLIVSSGVLLRDPVRMEWRLVPFSAIQAASERTRVRLNDRDAVECLSYAEANELSRQINKLRKLPRERRPQAIAEIHQVRDFKVIGEQLERFTRTFRSFRILSLAMFWITFGAFPLMVRFLGFAFAVLFFLTSAFAISIASGVLYHRRIASFDPDMHGVAKWLSTIHVALYPICVIRCLDGIAAQWCHRHDAVALAHALGGKPSAERVARFCIGQLPVSEPYSDRPELAAALEEYVARRTEGLRAFLKKIGIDLDALIAPPAPENASCKSYCPRCFTQYQKEGGNCSECAGARLQPLRTAPETRR